jgi:hypothetical protein
VNERYISSLLIDRVSCVSIVPTHNLLMVANASKVDKGGGVSMRNHCQSGNHLN